VTRAAIGLPSAASSSIESEWPTRSITLSTWRSPAIDHFGRDESSALWSAFSDLPALQIAGENDPRIFVSNLARVDVTERPVVISPANQRVECVTWTDPL
jgi:hypothetical protein